MQWRARTYIYCLSTTEVLNITFVPISVLFVVGKKTIFEDLCPYAYKADCLVLNFMSKTLLNSVQKWLNYLI